MDRVTNMTRRRRVSITEDDALQAKRLLWAGYTQVYIAKEVGVSQATIYQINAGLRFEWVPWPGGSTGPMPEFRIKELNRLDTEERRKVGRRRRVNDADEHIRAFHATASEDERIAAEEAAKAAAAAVMDTPKTGAIVERMRERGRKAREEG